ncbi:hypothetical protein CRUP_007472 [Coryphaenoides rupestris]|nr:hypothetical protein CRUP_007472 [Coryphaenoides rupestris]
MPRKCRSQKDLTPPKAERGVYEALPCHSECGRYAWRAEPWSMCNINGVDTPSSCGEGVQSRKIRSAWRVALGWGIAADNE